MEKRKLVIASSGFESVAKCHEQFSAAELLIDSIATGIILLDAQGVIQGVNRRAEELLEIRSVDVIGKTADMVPLRTAIDKVLSENCHDITVEMSVNGQVVTVRRTALHNAAGVFVGEVTELIDITEEKRERRQREEFVAMMTHDLKSPLTVLMGYLQNLRGEGDKISPAALQLSLAEMDRSAQRLLGMIEDVLDTYRLEVGLLQISKEYCDIKALIRSSCADIATESLQQGVNLTYYIDEGIPLVKVDGKQLSRVFANLLGNAVKFTPRRGSVAVTAELRDEHVVVVVQDTGIGIPAKDLSKIFAKYFRSLEAQGFKGSGLGLTISKAIVEAHGGTIRVESEAGEGSRFTILLPLQNLS